MATAKQKERIGKWIDKWKTRLLLDEWSVIVEYPEEPREDDPDGEPTLVDVIVNQMYKEARLRVYPEMFLESAAMQQVSITHELLHIKTDPIKQILELAVLKGIISTKRKTVLTEDLTEYITKLVHRNHQSNYKKACGYHL